MHTYKTQQQPDNSGENISQYNSTAFPTCSIRIPRVMLSIQTGYTPTASKVDNVKQIPQLLLISSVAVRNNHHSLVIQQEQQPAAVATSRNNHRITVQYQYSRCSQYSI
ncbi:hypothetical protein F511_19098 [Dorcoceras hygrometricum]|uniref:Uncharacterized protein n=1 Tax=Dorcoceras hygrometricum TaxID=472368 RepID=A0A2Z7AYW7_9LAMI|nr:hypothetical protein F511_19098 [Dorcoceras hygrometricum]